MLSILFTACASKSSAPQKPLVWSPFAETQQIELGSVQALLALSHNESLVLQATPPSLVWVKTKTFAQVPIEEAEPLAVAFDSRRGRAFVFSRRDLGVYKTSQNQAKRISSHVLPEALGNPHAVSYSILRNELWLMSDTGVWAASGKTFAFHKKNYAAPIESALASCHAKQLSISHDGARLHILCAASKTFLTLHVNKKDRLTQETLTLNDESPLGFGTRRGQWQFLTLSAFDLPPQTTHASSFENSLVYVRVDEQGARLFRKKL